MRLFEVPVAVICLISALAPGSLAPCWADSVPPSPSPARGTTGLVPEAVQLDLSALRRDVQPPGASTSPTRDAMPGPIHFKTGGGWSGMSTAKKTWIILGIVVGVGAIAVLVANHGDDNNGGGGY